MSKPYKELPIFFPQPLPEVDTTPVEELGGPSGQLNEEKSIDLGNIIAESGFYDDAQLIPSKIVKYDEPFTMEIDDTAVEFGEADSILWYLYEDGQQVGGIKQGPSQTYRLSEGDYPNLISTITVIEIRVVHEKRVERDNGFMDVGEDELGTISLSVIPATSDTDIGTYVPPPASLVYAPFVAKITGVSGDTIQIDKSYQDLVDRTNPIDPVPNEDSWDHKQPNETFGNWIISHKSLDRKDLDTYLHFGDDKRILVTNVKVDNKTIPQLPYSAVYKTYEPLPDDITDSDQVYVVREMLPPLLETVELVGYAQEDEDFQVLIPKDNLPQDSPITKRQTEFKTYNDLVTTDGRLKDEIEDKFLKETPAELSIDYSNYENFINFSSAEKRLNNFKYKVQQIEEQKVLSASFVGVTNGQIDLKIHHDKIRDIKNNFDGYEKYLYYEQSSYVTSSIGEFPNASWPKTGSGTYEIPYEPVSSSHADFISWYGSISSKTGQIYSASFYDTENGNRLVNLLPDHVKSDGDNIQFLDFMDMVGQQFDELWSYIKSVSDITDRRLDLEDGFSKDLVFNLAKSLGWSTQDGKDLLDLSRYGFGRKLSGTSYSLYTSGSLDSPTEADVSKEITKRLIASMPFILKSKGTVGSLKAILNCYGVPSTILKIREYGGLDVDVKRAPFETKRRFTKALGFRGAQHVSASWSDDSDTSRKPETIEFRFRAASGSNQTLVQKGTEWAIGLKDNGSSDNLGSVSFTLSGSGGTAEVSSSLLPVYDGDYYSVMLKKEKVETELFLHPSFETSSLFNPPFITGSSTTAVYGDIEIVSGSGVSRTGTKALRHTNNSNLDDNNTSYTLGFSSGSQPASVTSVNQNETYIFSAFAKVSGSNVDSIGRLRIFELDSDENVVNWNEDVNSSQTSINTFGGIKSSEAVGLVEDEWKNVTVTKTIRFPNTSKLGIRFENMKAESTIYWDDVSLRKAPSNTDTIGDSFNYQLFVKKYSNGIDKIVQDSNTVLHITGSTSSSYNASWTGSGILYIGGKPSDDFGAQLSGSMMEFRLWSEPLKEQFFENHVSDPKSYIGNTPSSSYESLTTRYSFDDNSALSDGNTIRDVSSNQTTTSPGYAIGFGGLNTFESVVDDTKTFVPNYGPNRGSSDKIRIEDNFLSGSGASLSTTERFDFSSNDFSPIDSPKVGIFFSPTDVVNDDIISSFANLDFNDLLGDPRDNFKLQYRDLKESADKYFKKYTGNNDFWDYMHLIKYYDQSIFKQFRKILPMRVKSQVGTVIEPNIFERSKNPIQRNHPSFTQIDYDSEINLTNFHYNTDTDGVYQEASHSILKIETEYPNYEGEIDSSDVFLKPSLYNFSVNDNFDDRNLYVSGSVTYGGPSSIYSEPTGAMIMNQRISENNKEYKFFYSSEDNYNNSSKYSINPFENLYNSRSLHETDLDTSYQDTIAFRRLFYEGVKNTSETTLDGDLPFVVTTTAPTVAVPTTKGISKLSVNQKGGKKKIKPKRRKLKKPRKR